MGVRTKRLVATRCWVWKNLEIKKVWDREEGFGNE